MAEGGLPPLPEESISVDDNITQDDSGVVVAVTEKHVMEAAVENEWERVKAAMLGQSQQRVALSLEAQVIVLVQAIDDDAWDFIHELAVHGFRFAPNVLHTVLVAALRNRNFQLGFMPKVLLSNDPNFLISVMGALCSEDIWFPNAYFLAQKLPQDLNVALLDEVVYLPLMRRNSGDMVLKMDILNLLRTRFY